MTQELLDEGPMLSLSLVADDMRPPAELILQSANPAKARLPRSRDSFKKEFLSTSEMDALLSDLWTQRGRIFFQRCERF
jgi:hypothetical protein